MVYAPASVVGRALPRAATATAIASAPERAMHRWRSATSYGVPLDSWKRSRPPDHRFRLPSRPAGDIAIVDRTASIDVRWSIPLRADFPVLAIRSRSAPCSRSGFSVEASGAAPTVPRPDRARRRFLNRTGRGRINRDPTHFSNNRDPRAQNSHPIGHRPSVAAEGSTTDAPCASVSRRSD
jgi:hypothetical protein